jgi:hypothetical protein
MQAPPPDVFWHFTATGWTAIGSIVGAASIIVLSVLNLFNLNAAFRATRAAESQSRAAQTSLGLLRDQLTLTERPFIAIHSEYIRDTDTYLVWAHNQGNGPALDVEVSLTFDEIPARKSAYSIGCMPTDGKFQFKIGRESFQLSAATIWYKSITGEEWTTKVALIGGHPARTNVAKEHLDKGPEYDRIMNLISRATQTEE